MGKDHDRYKQGAEIYKDYVVVRYIDKGQYGQVYQVKNSDGVSFALKVFAADVEMERRAFGLIKRQSSIRLVRVYEFGRTLQDEDCLLMAYHRQSFANLLVRQNGPMPLDVADHWFEQLLKALIVLERVGIIHRDIKPANLFVQDEILKIGDYGTSKFLVSDTLSHSTDAALTPFYAAPERFTRHYDMAVDRWSAAVIYFQMLSGQLPFTGDDLLQILGTINEASPDYSAVPEHLVPFLQTCFKKDPGERHADAEQMLAAFKEVMAGPAIKPADMDAQKPSVTVENVLLQECAACGEFFREGIVKDTVFYCLEHYQKLFGNQSPLGDSQPDPSRSRDADRDRGIRKVGTVSHSGQPPREFTNDLGMTFVWIEPGTFMMGSPEDEPGRFDDETLHQVTLPQGFYMQTTPVTQGQWQAVMDDNPSRFKDGGDTCPVERVSWEVAQNFIRKLNQRGDRITYGLPTEAQWEYAARAGTTTRFYFGDKLSTEQANYGKPLDSKQGTLPVGSFPPNAWGLYDMHGNVWEWCQDEYGDYPSGPVTDPKGPSSGARRVVRGGSWGSPSRGCRSAFRGNISPDDRNGSLGLRLAGQ